MGPAFLFSLYVGFRISYCPSSVAAVSFNHVS
jgi:hypothetical protein